MSGVMTGEDIKKKKKKTCWECPNEAFEDRIYCYFCIIKEREDLYWVKVKNDIPM